MPIKNSVVVTDMQAEEDFEQTAHVLKHGAKQELHPWARAHWNVII